MSGSDEFEMNKMMQEFKLMAHSQSWVEIRADWAKVMKQNFDSLVASGFSEEQALEIVKDRGMFL